MARERPKPPQPSQRLPISSKCVLAPLMPLSSSSEISTTESHHDGDPSISSVHGGDGLPVSAFHPDIIRSHILTRLDGPTLASLASTSSQLNSLCSEDDLWREICAATWPSSTDPRVLRIITSFPVGHRSFFSDSYPFLQYQRHNFGSSSQPLLTTTRLISAVDIYYKERAIFSRVQETETVTGWFLWSPFRVDLLDPKESAPTRIQYNGQLDDDTWTVHLEENLTLSWILIDPTQKRAANLSSGRPVSVHRHWLTGEVHVRFSAVVPGDCRQSETKLVDFAAEVVFKRSHGKEEEVCVSLVSLVAENMEERSLSGRDSLETLAAVMGGERTKGKRKGGEEEGKERYKEFVEEKKKLEERKQRREKAMDRAGLGVGFTMFFSIFVLSFYLLIVR